MSEAIHGRISGSTYVRAAEPTTVQWKTSCQYSRYSNRLVDHQKYGRRAIAKRIAKFGRNQIEGGL